MKIQSLSTRSDADRRLGEIFVPGYNAGVLHEKRIAVISQTIDVDGD